MSLKQYTGNIFRSYSDTLPRTWRSRLLGRPLATADAPHQTIGKLVGLAVFASDALSSTAYATQEILMVLAVAGTAAFVYSVPIAIAITALMVIVTISYEQTIHAYPGGGGAYIVARDNLGELPAQTAGAALLTDYILTVAVSISSGVAQITSAFPDLYPYRVWIAVWPGFLHHVRESARSEGIGCYLRHPNLLLCGCHDLDRRDWLSPLGDRQPGNGCESARNGGGNGRHSHYTLLDPACFFKRHVGFDRY